MDTAILVLLISSAVTYVIFTLLVFVVAGKQIMLKVKLLLGRKKGKGLVAELKDSRGLKLHVADISGKNLKLENRYYNVENKDYLISEDFNTKGIVVSENLRSSINPKTAEFNALDSTSLDNLIKRAIIDGQNHLFELLEKAKKILPIIVIGFGLGMLLILFFLFQIWNATTGGQII